MPYAVCYITGFNGFTVQSLFPDTFYRFANRHVGMQSYKLGGHYASGRIRGILQYFIDQLPGICIRVFQDTLDYIGRHFLHDVDHIVNIKLIDDFMQFCIGKTSDKYFLLIIIHFNKSLCGQALGQDPEQQQDILF